MSDSETKMARLKNRLVKIQGKIQDTMDDLQDHVHTKIERSKLTRFISHLSSEDRSSFDDNSLEDNEKTSRSSESADNVSTGRNKIPSVVIDEPDVDQDAKAVCKDFIRIERDNVLYKRRSLSATNLAYDDESCYSSSDSCFSCLSSSDER